MRTTTEVIHDHLSKRLGGDLEGDLQNYDPRIVQLTGSGVYRGHEGVRACAAELDRLIGSGTFEYTQTVIEGDYAFLEWTADNEGSRVRDGADSFVVRDGMILMQSIHYTVEDQR